MAATQYGLGRSSCTKTGHRGPRTTTLPMVSFRDNLVSGPSFFTEDDIPGSSLNGRYTNRLKNCELKFWCHGDSCKGLSTKAQLCYCIKRQVLRTSLLWPRFSSLSLHSLSAKIEHVLVDPEVNFFSYQAQQATPWPKRCFGSNLRSGVPLFSRREGTPDTIT